MKSILLASILAAVSVAAQPTGDFGMMRTMYGGTAFSSLLVTLFWVGLVLLVWLWVFKLWKELKHKK